MNRDPIGERGGVNLFGIARNNTANLVDRLGLRSWWDELVYGKDCCWVMDQLDIKFEYADTARSRGAVINFINNPFGVLLGTTAYNEIGWEVVNLFPDLGTWGDLSFSFVFEHLSSVMIGAGVSIIQDNPIYAYLESSGVSFVVGGKISDVLRSAATGSSTCQDAKDRLALNLNVLGPAIVAQDAWKRFETSALRICPSLPTRYANHLSDEINHWQSNLDTLIDELTRNINTVRDECGVDLTQHEGDEFDYRWWGRIPGH